MCASVSVRFCGYMRLCLSLCVCVYVSVCRIGGGGGGAGVCVLIAVRLCGSACGCLCLFVHVSVCGIFNVCTDVDACECTRELYRHLKTDSGRKIPCRTGDSNPRQYCAWPLSQPLYQLSCPRP